MDYEPVPEKSKKIITDGKGATVQQRLMLAVGNIKTVDPELGKPHKANPANIDICVQFVLKVVFSFITNELLRRASLEQ
jgi:hypothetical protein